MCNRPPILPLRSAASRVRASAWFAAGLLLLGLCPGSARATPLVYDGFKYTAGTTLDAVTPNSSTVGLNQGMAYGGQGTSAYTVTASSLVLSNFATSGGAVSFATGTNVAAAQLSLGSSPYVGTLYNSYLVTLTSRSTVGTSDGALVRIADSNGSTNDRFDTEADSRKSSTEVAVGYDGGTTLATNTGVSLALNTTYLIVGRYTNVGNTLSTSSPGVGTVYALTAAQFDSFIAGGADDGYLDGATVGSGAANVTARVSDANVTSSTINNFRTGDFAALVAVNDTGTFDEMRYGTTLADVTPVPEPASAGLFALAATLFGLRRPRR